jgi:hypothetical protein
MRPDVVRVASDYMRLWARRSVTADVVARWKVTAYGRGRQTDGAVAEWLRQRSAKPLDRSATRIEVAIGHAIWWTSRCAKLAA